MRTSEQHLQLGIFDINGTIHTAHAGVSEEVTRGFQNLHNLNIQTTVITGRSLGTARELLGDTWQDIVSPSIPVAVENGGRLVDQQGQNIIFRRLKSSTIDAVISAIESSPTAVSYVAYTPKDSRAKNALWLPEGGSAIEYIAANGNHVTPTRERLSKFAARLATDQACMLRIGTGSFEIMEMLKGTNVFVNMAELNILAEGVDKATGVTDIAEYLDVPLSHVLVAGNDFNDLPMLGLPVAAKIFIPGTTTERTAYGNDVVEIGSPSELGTYLNQLRGVDHEASAF